jgi:hypothetical protein
MRSTVAVPDRRVVGRGGDREVARASDTQGELLLEEEVRLVTAHEAALRSGRYGAAA